jgi:hypothetical protein
VHSDGASSGDRGQGHIPINGPKLGGGCNNQLTISLRGVKLVGCWCGRDDLRPAGQTTGMEPLPAKLAIYTDGGLGGLQHQHVD